MKRVHRVLATATAALAMFGAQAGATAAPKEADRPGLQRRLDDVVAAGAVGTMAEVRDEHGVWRSTSGVAEVGTPRPVPVRGRFRAGSITKTFVATVVLQLVDEGRLRLDDTVEAWLPGAVPDGHHITVRHLLNHTSGVYDYLRTLPMPPQQEFFDNRWRTWTAAELIQRAVDNPPTFEPPGSAFAYSNTGYLLLGQIIETVTGRFYGEEIERRVIRPLHLRGTSVPRTSPRIRGPHPHGYVPTLHDNEMHLTDYTETNPSVMGASGGMISTTRDLNRFFAALLGGRLLPPHLLVQMEAPGVTGGEYGLGLARRETSCGVRAYGNDGDALTYKAWSFSTLDRRHQVTVALTPNFRGEPDDAVDEFLDQALCGRPVASIRETLCQSSGPQALGDLRVFTTSAATWLDLVLCARTAEPRARMLAQRTLMPRGVRLKTHASAASKALRVSTRILRTRAPIRWCRRPDLLVIAAGCVGTDPWTCREAER